MIEDLRTQLAAQAAESARLRDALSFYIDGKNWFDNGGDENGDCRAISSEDLVAVVCANPHERGGKHAAEALSLPATSAELRYQEERERTNGLVARLEANAKSHAIYSDHPCQCGDCRALAAFNASGDAGPAG